MRIIKLTVVLLCIIILVNVPSTSEQLTLPPQNYKHWQKLEKVCKEGKKTYGANEFVENGKVCKWTFVPYWPEKR